MPLTNDQHDAVARALYVAGDEQVNYGRTAYRAAFAGLVDDLADVLRTDPDFSPAVFRIKCGFAPGWETR